MAKMKQYFSLKTGALALSCIALAACSGGSSTNTPANNAPTANAGTAQSVDELSMVTLNGSGSDPDGDTVTYAWFQTVGTTVTINNANMATATFDAPDVTAASTPATLTFRLTVSDGSLNTTSTVDITVNDVGLGANSPPTANAGPDQDVAELVTVNLDGTGSSDADGDTFSFAWMQTGGPNAPLTGANTAQPSFTSPNVAAGITETLTFELTVDDGTDTATDQVNVDVSEPLSMVTVAGVLVYERPTVINQCQGYNFNAITNMPVRRATVQLLDAANNVLGTTQTDDNGDYSFSNISANTNVRVRVRAELLQTTGPQTWEVYVRDNTSQTAQPLNQRPIYEVQWALFNTGIGNIFDADFVARTGWIGGSYGATRAAAPLSILDAIADAVIMIEGADAIVDMGRLDAFWSVNNTFTGNDDPDNGELVTTYFSSNPDGGAANPSLFLLGDAVGRLPDSVIDTDEFDRGVLQHEWGHYFEYWFSRSNSIGGSHQIPGTVEARVAFGEGWGYGISAIVGGDPLLCDTGAPASSGFGINVEFENRGTQGFFNEMSVATLIYDLFDTNVDGVDNDSIGFAPIYETMTNFQRDTEALTTLFSFATGLLANVDPADVSFVNALLNRENVDTGSVNIWATGQTTQPATWTNGKPVRDLLPLYTQITPGGGTINLCVNDDQVIEQHGNKPGEWRYLRFTTSNTRAWTLTVQANPVPPPTGDPAPTPPDELRDRADPDVYLYRDGVELGRGWSGADDVEVFITPSLSADEYTVAFQDWRYEDESKSSDYPPQVCFDFTLN